MAGLGSLQMRRSNVEYKTWVRLETMKEGSAPDASGQPSDRPLSLAFCPSGDMALKSAAVGTTLASRLCPKLEESACHSSTKL